jgi:K+-sensing histidine kinase KdpD
LRYAVAVEDDGAGVPEGMEDRLFTWFAHQGEASPGSGSVGLVLAVARLLAEAMGGSLDYEHITGRTSFVLTPPGGERTGGCSLRRPARCDDSMKPC